MHASSTRPQQQLSSASASATVNTSGEQTRRDLSRERQMRYRLRKAQHERDLEAAVERVRGEVVELARQCARAVSPSTVGQSVDQSARLPGVSARALATAQRFVDCFTSGFSPSSAAPWLPRAYTRADRAAPVALGAWPLRGQAQIAFVEEVVDVEVRWGGRRGQNMFLEHWRRYASVCDGFHVDGASFRVWPFEGRGGGASESAVCHVGAVMSLGVNASTLRTVLPTLERRRPDLARRLLGQRLRLPATFALSLDAAGRVHGFDARLDWCLALRPLVGSMADAAAALEGANVSLGGQIGREPGAPAVPPVSANTSGSTSGSSSSGSGSSGAHSLPQMRLAFLLTPSDH